MIIEIITTGDEIMSGVTQDTNFHWLADKLVNLGFDLCFHTSVGDDREAIARAFETARARAQAVIISGGLGPTSDDLTAEVASLFFGVPLELNNEALEMMKRRFEKRGFRFLEINKKQAYIPKGSRLLKNFWGTAPGFQHEINGVVFFCLPGVPKEFGAMIEEYVITELECRSTARKKYRNKLIRTFGLRESEVADKLRGIEREGLKIGYRAHFPEIHLIISAYGETEHEAENLLSGLLEEIISRLGGFVFSVNGETIEEIVGNLLSQKKLSLALAESCTGGLVAHRITNIPGSSNYFERGVVSYSNESKVEVLGVSRELIESYGAVSAQVVEAMAEGIRRLGGSDLGAGISGIAGPHGGTQEKPVGTVYIGISHRDKGVFSRRYQFMGTREEIKLVTSTTTLDLIRKFVLSEV